MGQNKHWPSDIWNALPHSTLTFEATINNQITQCENQININHLTCNAKSNLYKVQFMTKEHFWKVQF